MDNNMREERLRFLRDAREAGHAIMALEQDVEDLRGDIARLRSRIGEMERGA